MWINLFFRIGFFLFSTRTISTEDPFLNDKRKVYIGYLSIFRPTGSFVLYTRISVSRFISAASEFFRDLFYGDRHFIFFTRTVIASVKNLTSTRLVSIQFCLLFHHRKNIFKNDAFSFPIHNFNELRFSHREGQQKVHRVTFF